MTQTIRVVQTPQQEAMFEFYDEFPGVVAAIFGAAILFILVAAIVSVFGGRCGLRR